MRPQGSGHRVVGPSQVHLSACSGRRGSQNPTFPASWTLKLTDPHLAAGLQAPGLQVVGPRERPCPVRGLTICQAGSFQGPLTALGPL